MQFGYFDEPNHEYVITRPDTPRPWSNYIGSAQFGGLVTNNAAGYTFYQSADQGRLTRYRFGCDQFKNGNRAKSPAVEIHSHPCSIAKAACHASATYHAGNQPRSPRRPNPPTFPI